MKKFPTVKLLIFAALAITLGAFVAAPLATPLINLYITGDANRNPQLGIGRNPDNNRDWELDGIGDVRLMQATSGTVGHLILTDDSVQIDHDSTVLVKVKDKLAIVTSDSAVNVSGNSYFISGSNIALGIVGNGNKAANASDSVFFTTAPNLTGTSQQAKWLKLRLKATAGGTDTTIYIPYIR